MTGEHEPRRYHIRVDTDNQSLASHFAPVSADDGDADLASWLVKKIWQRQSNIKYFQGTIGGLLGGCTVAADYGRGTEDPEFISLLRSLEVLVAMLSTSGLALLLDIETVRNDLCEMRRKLSRLSFMPPGSPEASKNESKLEDVEKAQMQAAQEKLVKYRSSADKLFCDYKVRPDDLKRFVLSPSFLRMDETPVAEDEICKVYPGEIVLPNKPAEKTHVKILNEIQGGAPEDISKRTIFLTHLLRACDNIVRPKFVVLPNKILMEPTTLVTLDTVLKEQTKLDSAQKVEIALKIAGALALAHSFNIVHRDVRLTNVVMTAEVRDGQVLYVPKLTGFEICRHVKYDYSLRASMASSVYHAPEKTSWHGSSAKTDVFAFGVLLYEISMGTPPVMQGPRVTKGDLDVWHGQEYGNLSVDYSMLMRSCLALDFQVRPEMQDVAKRLAGIASQLNVRPPPRSRSFGAK